MSSPDTIRNAEDAVRAYIDAEFQCEYGYDCTVNPEGVLSEAELYRLVTEAKAAMMDARAALSDKEEAGVLYRVQRQDPDGSHFAVVVLDDVRAHLAGNVDVFVVQTPDRPPGERVTGQVLPFKKPSIP
jgi:hypothetical protein